MYRGGSASILTMLKPGPRVQSSLPAVCPSIPDVAHFRVAQSLGVGQFVADHVRQLNGVTTGFLGIRRSIRTQGLSNVPYWQHARCPVRPRGRHMVPMRLRNTPLWLYFRSVRSSEKSVKL